MLPWFIRKVSYVVAKSPGGNWMTTHDTMPTPNSKKTEMTSRRRM